MDPRFHSAVQEIDEGALVKPDRPSSPAPPLGDPDDHAYEMQRRTVIWWLIGIGIVLLILL